MKLAHIIPPAAVGPMAPLLGDYHLLLPSLVPDTRYRDEYRHRREVAVPGFYMLDNGIAEGKATDFPHLLAMAKVMGADEVILPDVMKDMDRTLRAVAQAFYPAFECRHKYKFMFVLQGQDIAECVHSAVRAMNMYPGIINTFGIPRHILSRGSHARQAIATRLALEFPFKPVHLLGMHPEHSNELLKYGEAYAALGVRGIDTSLAWNATLAGEPLNGSDNLTIERQPIEEFRKAEPTVEQLDLLWKNIGVMNEWTK
jgi:hypothetical protein